MIWKEQIHSERMNDWHAFWRNLLQICICLFVVLTFSFALPACFCTVFAINAPLLSAIFFKLFERRWLYNFSPQNTISTSKLNRLFHNESQPKRTNGSAEKHWRLDTKLRAEVGLSLLQGSAYWQHCTYS